MCIPLPSCARTGVLCCACRIPGEGSPAHPRLQPHASPRLQPHASPSLQPHVPKAATLCISQAGGARSLRGAAGGGRLPAAPRRRDFHHALRAARAPAAPPPHLRSLAGARRTVAARTHTAAACGTYSCSPDACSCSLWYMRLQLRRAPRFSLGALHGCSLGAHHGCSLGKSAPRLQAHVSAINRAAPAGAGRVLMTARQDWEAYFLQMVVST